MVHILKSFDLLWERKKMGGPAYGVLLRSSRKQGEPGAGVVYAGPTTPAVEQSIRFTSKMNGTITIGGR
jgi:hypothetical protein